MIILIISNKGKVYYRKTKKTAVVSTDNIETP